MITTVNQQPTQKIPKTKMRNAVKMVAQIIVKMVNSVLHCNTNHHMTMISLICFLFLLGYLQGFICIFKHNCCEKGDKFHSQSFVKICYAVRTLQVLSDILFTFQLHLCLHEKGPWPWITQFFVFSFLSSMLLSVSTKQVRFLSFAFFVKAIIPNVHLAGPQQGREQAPQKRTATNNWQNKCVNKSLPTFPSAAQIVEIFQA